MLTGNLVLARMTKERVVPRYLDREKEYWLDIAESLLMIFRESIGRTRGELEEEIALLFGEGAAAGMVPRGLAKVLEDRSEFEVVADRPPEELRAVVFEEATRYRQGLKGEGRRAPFRRDVVIERVTQATGLSDEQITAALFADLKDENRLLSFKDISALALVDRYNVALAQAVLLKSVRLQIELRGETPATYRQFFGRLKFHRLLHRIEGSANEGFRVHVDGPMSLFSSTTKYGLQIASFLPMVLQCRSFRLDAEVRWGPKKLPRLFHLEAGDGLVAPSQPQGQYVPAEIKAFVERFRQIAPGWDVAESPDVVSLGREVWAPDYLFTHRASGREVWVEVLGFWRRTSLERLLRLLPAHRVRHVLAVSDRWKVDEETVGELAGSILRFKDVPNAQDMLALLNEQIRD